MTFAAALTSREFAVALEITPPQKPLPAVLLRRAQLLGGGVRAINVIQRPGRQPSLDACIFLRAEGFAPTWHLVTRGATRAELAVQLGQAAAGGIQQVLCIRGDHAGSDSPDTPSIREAIGMVRDLLPGALIGATMNHYAPDQGAALKNLLPKLRAGATYVQTQPVFDLAQLEPIAQATKDAVPGTSVVAMVMPILSLEAARRIEERIGVRLPDGLRARLATGDAEDAWAAFDETLAALHASPLVDGVAVMTFEMDAPRSMGARILQGLRAAGCRV
ncbi:MAG: hypothetical protein C0506_14155 [Anaerolinea sp.]|nr:hypothetical protein [Anaerolinea sp.]